MFSSRDYAEMHYYYGYARGNAAEASRLYRAHVERRGGPQPERFPDYRMILRVHNAYLEGRSPGTRDGRMARMPNPDVVDAVVEEVERDPSTSVRIMSRRTGISKSQVHRTLRSVGYHPFHIRKVQQLKPEDYNRRIQFCEEMLRRQAENENFFNQILWTDESHFRRNGIFNMHNSHSWSIENPNLKRESTFQEQFSVNLWSGILNGQLIGPFQLPDRLNGHQFLNFLRNDLPLLLEDIDIETRRNMVLQCDGAPCHYAMEVRNHLNRRFSEKWIGRCGRGDACLIAWPPRSPDLNPIDFFVWGYYKDLVYSRECRNLVELTRKLRVAEETIKNNEMAFRCLKDNFFRRCRICIEQQGGHFENFL